MMAVYRTQFSNSMILCLPIGLFKLAHHYRTENIRENLTSMPFIFLYVIVTSTIHTPGNVRRSCNAC